VRNDGGKEGEENKGEEDQEVRDCEEDRRGTKERSINLFYEIKRHGLKPFEGASVDFHWKRELVVFIPGEPPIIAVVKHEELLEFLLKNGVRKVLVDALFLSRAQVLMEISKAGIEVYFIRRTTIIKKFKRYLRKHKIKVPTKNDFVDAVLQAFIAPKFIQQIDWRDLECWKAMTGWRKAYALCIAVQQGLSATPEEQRDMLPVKVDEDKVLEAARKFVNTVEMHYPGVKQIFAKIGIADDDVIAQALCYEIIIETCRIEKFSDVLKKAGIGIPSTPKRRKRTKKEPKDEPKESKKFIHDGRLLFALVQLTIKLYHLNPRRDQEKIKWKAPKLLKRIWKCSRELQTTEEGGRVGEALG
jgi:hypothetical protein